MIGAGGCGRPARRARATSIDEVVKVDRQIARLDHAQQLELFRRLERRLQKAAPDPAERRERLAKLSQQMREWTTRDPDHDDAWWDDFERELRENRLQFRIVDFGDDDA